MKQGAAVLLILFLGTLATGCGCVSADPALDMTALRELIEEKNRAFTKAHITGEVEVINSYFSEDARIFLPNAELVTGSADIAELNSQYIEYGITEFREETTTLYGNEQYLIEEGLYYMTYGEDNTVENGKYINIWKPVDGDWKVQSNIWNSNMPAIP
jgi:ketosteroid isomerase-like protein